MPKPLNLNWRESPGPGSLIVVEGFDASGKSTQIDALARRLRSSGQPVLMTRQPSDWYRSSHEVRNFLDHGGTPETARALALFAAADRLMHCDQIILPAIKQGTIVICDRYVFSSIAFFKHRGLPEDFITRINEGVIRPDVAICLRVPSQVSLERLHARDGNSLKHEEKSLEVIEAIASNFDEIGPPIHYIDGNRRAELVTEAIWEICSPALAESRNIHC